MTRSSLPCLLAVIFASVSTTRAFSGHSKCSIRYAKVFSRHMAVAAVDDSTPAPTTTARVPSVDSAEFPPPLTPFEKFQRAATFWSTAVPIVANYYGLIGNLRLQELLGTPLKEEDVEVRGYMIDIISASIVLSKFLTPKRLIPLSFFAIVPSRVYGTSCMKMVPKNCVML